MERKNKDTQSKKKKNDRKKNKKTSNQVSIFTLLFIAAIIVVIVLCCNMVNWIVQYIRYNSYTNQMDYYGYNKLYSNNKATAHQKVTNIDMIKVVLGSINNTTDIANLALEMPTKDNPEDNLWYQVAKDMNLITNIEVADFNRKSTVIDAIICIMKTLEKNLGVKLEETTLNIDNKSLEEFTADELSYIKKAVTIGIISNESSSINNSKLIKGELNKLIIEIVNRYATLHYDTVKLDQNGMISKNDIYIVTDKEELPKNKKDYPYVISSIDKSVYEIDYIVENDQRFQKPKEVYNKMGNLYGQIASTIKRYFNDILNVDYTNITTYDYINKLNMSTMYKQRSSDVQNYIDYVKENKIILKGQAEPLLPIIYNTGDRYVVRTKITFEVVNSKTDINLLFGDAGNNVKYNGKEITMYVDIPMGLTLNSNTLLVDVNCNAMNMVKENKNIAVKGEEI